jgi:hypothetical protein
MLTKVARASGLSGGFGSAGLPPPTAGSEEAASKTRAARIGEVRRCVVMGPPKGRAGRVPHGIEHSRIAA